MSDFVLLHQSQNTWGIILNLLSFDNIIRHSYGPAIKDKKYLNIKEWIGMELIHLYFNQGETNVTPVFSGYVHSIQSHNLLDLVSYM